LLPRQLHGRADPDPSGQELALPAWIPGSYMIREFARHVVSIRAESRGRSVAIEKTDKHTWRAQPCVGPLTVTCEVYARDLSVRGAYLDPRQGLFNGACLFLRPKGHEASACELEIRATQGRALSRLGSRHGDGPRGGEAPRLRRLPRPRTTTS